MIFRSLGRPGNGGDAGEESAEHLELDKAVLNRKLTVRLGESYLP